MGGMADEQTPTEIAASAAVDNALTNGQSEQIGDISQSKTPALSAYQILEKERARKADALGRRPLFRGINLSCMGAQ